MHKLTSDVFVEELDPRDDDYRSITEKMHSTIAVDFQGQTFLGYKIHKIGRVSNAFLRMRYLRRLNQIEQECGQPSEELQVFHGTNTAKEIMIHGFNLANAKFDGWFGKGLSSYSNQFTCGGFYNECWLHSWLKCTACVRSILICTVALGKWLEVSQPRFKAPPPGYHSIVSHPSMYNSEFVIYNNYQAIPDFIVEYQVRKYRKSSCSVNLVSKLNFNKKTCLKYTMAQSSVQNDVEPLCIIEDVAREEEEYSMISRIMHFSIAEDQPYSGYDIRKISRVRNDFLWAHYNQRLNEINEELGDCTSDEIILFHGTRGTRRTEAIARTGFKVEYANPDCLFGQGIYFSRLSSHSSNFSCDDPCYPHRRSGCTECLRTILLCRVALGRSYTTDNALHGMVALPPGFHSLIALPNSSYSEYVIFNNYQVYPSFIVEFRCLS
ncbi:Hypothetical predicted protein [Cloeon dipterum]|uniref:Poly [ADP-ribose] polymerase n=1 Tax=Cloeon dipterum TaxID=197152 RepID=A0A8S1CZD6_9INSE|nr:Hypothetical predicted protein [Cloeon dipterum]